MSKIVLITGCSTGIGRDLAERLTQSGYTVVATARRGESMEGLQAALKIPLDVTQSGSIDQAVATVIKQYGQIDVLVNNAGYAIRGVIEEAPIQKVQQMYDVNVFGVLRVIQAVAPHMRKKGAGRIINISSIAGKLSTPTNGTYSSTKFALEALSDALRLELAPFCIQVVLVEPGAIKTNFDETSIIQSQGLPAKSASPYRAHYLKNEQFARAMRKNEPGPEVVSVMVQKAIEAAHPKARYLAGVAFSGRITLLFRDFLWDVIMKQMFNIKSTDIKTG
jgi:NADP-dependent 3-hydroxy acid dehydrogenase YdfG